MQFPISNFLPPSKRLFSNFGSLSPSVKYSFLVYPPKISSSTDLTSSRLSRTDVEDPPLKIEKFKDQPLKIEKFKVPPLKIEKFKDPPLKDYSYRIERPISSPEGKKTPSSKGEKEKTESKRKSKLSRNRKMKDEKIVAELIEALKTVEAHFPKTARGKNDFEFPFGSFLSPWRGKLNCYHVNMVLKSQTDSGLALAFFDWAKSQPSFFPNQLVFNKVIQISGRAQKFEAMENILEVMIRCKRCFPDVATFTEMIKSYSLANRYEDAMKTFGRLKEHKISPNLFTYSVLIDMNRREGNFEVALKIYEEIKRDGFQMDTTILTTVIHLYGKMGRFTQAQRLFYKMLQSPSPPSVCTYNLMLDLYQKNWKLDRAMDLFKEMHAGGIRPDMTTYCTMLSIYLKLKSMAEIDSLREDMVRLGMKPSIVWYNVLLEFYIQECDFAKVDSTFEKMEEEGIEKDGISYSLLLIACLKRKLLLKANQILSEMTALQYSPGLRVYSNCMLPFTHCNDKKEMLLIFGLMKQIQHPVHDFFVFLLNVEMANLNDDSNDLDDVKSKVRLCFKVLSTEPFDYRFGFLNCLIHHLVKWNRVKLADLILLELPDSGFIKPILNQTPSYWSIDLRKLSHGMAIAYLRLKLLDLYEMASKHSSTFPKLAKILVASGNYKSDFETRDFKSLLTEYLRRLNSPFRLLEKKVLTCRGSDLKRWLLKPGLVQILTSNVL